MIQFKSVAEYAIAWFSKGDFYGSRPSVDVLVECDVAFEHSSVACADIKMVVFDECHHSACGATIVKWPTAQVA